MASAQDLALERLQEAVIDGRTENIRYRQDQLQFLHKALRENASSVCDAISQDSRSSSLEAETEYYLTMDAVRHFYETLDFRKDLAQEYNVANGKNNSSRRVGVGLVMIRPTSHTRLYSIVSPLAAAIASGNCVILELPETLLQVDSVLRPLLTEALDANTFYISKTLPDDETSRTAILVDQTGSGPCVTQTTQLLSSATARTVAIVDRTANIELAAKAITAARFSFGGSSPYAPDLVLVNEYVKSDFFEACSKFATLRFARESVAKRISGNENEAASRKAVKEAEDKKQVSSFGSNDFKLVDVIDRNTQVTRMKIRGRYLLIATFSSLVDAIFTHKFETPLLAGYFFAEPAAAKYLSQHLSCHISLVNQIPVQLLLGPAAPIAHAPDFLYRYSREMFTTARPQFVEPVPESLATAEELLAGSTKVSAHTLRARATAPLEATRQPSNWQLGFFEAGFLYGAGIVLTVALPLFGWTSYLLVRRGYEFATKFRRS